MTGRFWSRHGFLRVSCCALLAATPFSPLSGFLVALHPGRAWWRAAGELRHTLLSPSAAVVGEAYLALAPEERDETSLARLVGLDLFHRRTSFPEVRDRITGDFELGDTVRVDGWVLSHTEARLYALAALIQS